MPGTFSLAESCSADQEFSMQAIVDKVKRALTFKHPVADDDAQPTHIEAKEFASELLENVRRQLARRTLDAGRH
jgi:hypothetical protein